MVTAAWFVGMVGFANLGILLLPPGNLRAAIVFVLLWVLPGWAWGCALQGRSKLVSAKGVSAEPISSWLLGLGLGVAVNVLGTLLIVYIPGPFPFWLSLIAFSLLALLPVLIFRPPRLAWPSPCVFVVSLLLIAIFFRLVNLGYSEFQGDEGIIMVRAASAIQGNEAELFLHQKGPVEILMPLATWRLSGTLNELWARLPFAWASTLGVMVVACLGTRWFGSKAGWLAGLILAINGFHVAFGRIVQYQSLVVWMGMLSLLALDEYRERGRPVDLMLGAAFLAVGVLAHYEAVLFAPAALALALRWTPGKPWRIKDIIANPAYLYALLFGCAILALFFLPFMFHPNFIKTAGYVAQGRVGSGLHLNLDKIWVMSTLYNSAYYVVLLLLLIGFSLFWVRRSWNLFLAWLVFVIPFVFYCIIVLDPRTHIYTFFPGAALLAGAALAGLWQRVGQTKWRWGVVAVGSGLYILCAWYAWLAFVSHTPEYQRTWPAHQSALYWTTWRQMPLHGRFGFPHQAGWHAIGALMAQGTIEGVYASNEEQEITDWYTSQAPRTHCPRPDVYIIAENVQDQVSVDWGEIEHEYHLSGVVTVNGEPRIRWYTRRMNLTRDPVEVMKVDGAGYRLWWRLSEVVPPDTGWTYAADYNLDGRIELLGYDVEAEQAAPGGWVRVTLYWRTRVPLARNYQVFVHLYDGRKLWAQHDGAPECAINPTTRWEPGQVIPDPHLVSIPADMPPGSIPVYVGMYDLLTLERLPVSGVADGAIHLTDVLVHSQVLEQKRNG